jgi:hypothetical protein
VYNWWNRFVRILILLIDSHAAGDHPSIDALQARHVIADRRFGVVTVLGVTEGNLNGYLHRGVPIRTL